MSVRQQLMAVAAALLALGLTACSRTVSTASPASTATSAGAGDGASSLQPVAVDEKTLGTVKTETVGEREEANTLEVAGKVAFDEDRVARVLTPVNGQVVDLHLKVGDAVRKGQELCSIRSRDIAQAVEEHTESHNDLDLATRTLAMTQDLFDHQAASKMALQQAESDLAKAKTRVSRSEEALRSLGLAPDPGDSTSSGRVPITAPIGGSVIERKVTEGQFVQTDTSPIITIADLSTVWVLGDVFERDLRLIAIGKPATVSVSAYPGERFEGRIDYISDAIDPMTRTAKVRISVPNPGSRLKAEMFASVSITVGSASRVLTVPSSAAFTEAGKTFAYIMLDRTHFVRRPVELGPDRDGERRVLSGLKAGDQVVTDGGLQLRQEEEQDKGAS